MGQEELRVFVLPRTDSASHSRSIESPPTVQAKQSFMLAVSNPGERTRKDAKRGNERLRV